MSDPAVSQVQDDTRANAYLALMKEIDDEYTSKARLREIARKLAFAILLGSKRP